MDDAESDRTKSFVSLQGYMKACGIADHNISCAAAFILDNIAKRYPTQDLITAHPFSAAFEYLLAAGLITDDKTSPEMTELGSQVYALRTPRIRFVQ